MQTSLSTRGSRSRRRWTEPGVDLQDPPPPGARTSRGLHVAVAHPDVPAPPRLLPPPLPAEPAVRRSQARRVAERGFDRERARVHRSIVTTREFVSFCRTTTRAPTSALRHLRLYCCITVGIGHGYDAPSCTTVLRTPPRCTGSASTYCARERRAGCEAQKFIFLHRDIRLDGAWRPVPACFRLYYISTCLALSESLCRRSTGNHPNV